MPSITLTDSTAVTVDATLSDPSVLGKTPGSVLRFLRSDVIGALDQTLDQVQISSLALGFSYQPVLELTGGTATFQAGGGLTGELDLLKPAASLFPEDQFGTEVPMQGAYYLALGLQLAAGATGVGSSGAFTFTLAAAAAATAKLYLPFGKAATGAYPTLRASLATLLSFWRLPSEVSDFAAWPLGTVFTFDCQGSVAFSASFDVLAAVNPTASPGISAAGGPFAVSAGPSFTIAGGFTLAGEFETRLWKRADGTLELGYYKKQGKAFTLSYAAGAGADVTVGGTDLVAKLYGLLGDKGKLDADWLQNNVPKDVVSQVSTAYAAAVQTKFSVEFDGECDSTFTDQAAFSWRFDLAVAGGAAEKALSAALRGEVAPLLHGPLPAGVTAVGSILDRIRETKRTFVFNFLGLFDHATVNDAVLDLQTKVTEDGQLILTDTAHLTRLAADSTPFVKGDKLRHVFVEDGTATVSYAAAAGGIVPSLTVKYLYFEFKSRATVDDLSRLLDTASEIVDEDAHGPWGGILDARRTSQTASLYAVLNYDVASARALFLDKGGNARAISAYTDAVRSALGAMPSNSGLDPRFLEAVNDNGKWQGLVDAGTDQGMYSVLGVSLTTPPMWAKMAWPWVHHIASWAAQMHSAGQALQSVTQFLQQHPSAPQSHDPQFQLLRQNFASLVKVAIQGAPIFDDVFGVLSLLEAAPPAGQTVTMTYAGRTENYS